MANIPSPKCITGPKGVDLGPLFDPVWSPEMYAVADRAMRGLRAAMARGEIDYGGGAEYARNRGPECDPDNIEDGVLLVNYVGHDGVQVVRGGEGQHFAALFQATWRLIASARTHHDCVVRLAPSCTGAVSSGHYSVASSCSCSQSVRPAATTRLRLPTTVTRLALWSTRARGVCPVAGLGEGVA